MVRHTSTLVEGINNKAKVLSVVALVFLMQNICFRGCIWTLQYIDYLAWYQLVRIRGEAQRALVRPIAFYRRSFVVIKSAQ